MKKLSSLGFGLISLVLLSNVTVRADGYVGFANIAGGPSGSVNAPVTNLLTAARVKNTDGVVAGLYFAVDGETNEALYTYVPSFAVFQSGAQAGYFFNGARTVPGTEGQTYVMVQVRAWETNYGATYEAAVAAPSMNGRKSLVGKSNLVRARLTFPPSPPSNLVGLQGFTVDLVGGGPFLSINDITVAEGSNGVVNAVFTVTMGGPQSQAVTVDFTTQDGTALAGQDYTATNGTLTYAAGVTIQNIIVPLTPDGPAEPEESFSIVLGNPVNGSINKGTGTCLITEARIDQIRLDTVITFHTVPGRRYAVEVTTDMQTWTAVTGAENITATSDTTSVSDKGVGCSGTRIYRTQLLFP
jgi:hypothetical protein